jgi:hypothetical protein
MTVGTHFSEYDDASTSRCERALVTLLGDVGSPWRERIVLVGGLVPRYLIGAVPPDVPPHVGTTDIDLALSLVVPEGADEAYRTLENNLKKSGFTRGNASFRWARAIDGMTVVVEFLCEVEGGGDGGRIHKPHGQKEGNLGALQVRGCSIVERDCVIRRVQAERLDGGRSAVEIRVCGLTAFLSLKIDAFQDRHKAKDAYDLVFTLLNWPGGPAGAAAAVNAASARGDPFVDTALRVMGERFVDHEQDGPVMYSTFVCDLDADPEERARQRLTAVDAVQIFLAALAQHPSKR